MKYQDLESRTIKRFIKANNIDIKRIIQLPEAKTISGKNINPIAFNYGIWGKYEDSIMSIANIVGAGNFDLHDSTDIIDSMTYYFGDKSSDYTYRADTMLKYSKYNIMEGLNKSFKNEPMYADEYEPMKYVIAINGMHRYHILRIYYLNEITQPNLTEEQKKAIDERFSIPIRSKKLDYIKTYCNFLLRITDEKIRISNEYDEDYNFTGKSVIKLPNNERLVLTDIELIEYVKEKVPKDTDLINYIQEFYNIDSFNNFIENFFPELNKERRVNRGI